LKSLIDHNRIQITLQRLAHQLLENHPSWANSAIVGIQPRGTRLSDRIVDYLRNWTGDRHIAYGKLDITFYRDDIHQGGVLVPSTTDMDFGVSGKRVILIDDVLHTGRTIRAAMDALLDFGRPEAIELMVLIDRRFSRELPIQPDYTGLAVDTIMSQKVLVKWEETDGKDEVILLD